MLWLALGFLVTAVLYASVGFGGGSTYNALLVLVGTDYELLPSIALVCNLVVVTGGTLRYASDGHLNLRFALPFVILSVPMAWLGGRLPIGRETFILVLGLALVASGLALWVGRSADERTGQVGAPLWSVGVPLGGIFGFLAGLVGIGGGIFLAPSLHLMRLATAKRIAATASFFIMVNSIAGLIGQAMKHDSLSYLSRLSDYVWLVAAVLLGGQIGSHLGTRVLSERVVKRMTAVLVIYVGGRLLWLIATR